MRNSDIFILDDELDICTILQDILKDHDITSEYFTNIASFYDAIDTHIPRIILLDISLNDQSKNGIDVLSDLISNGQVSSKIILMSAHGNNSTALNAISQGAYDYIDKPFSENKLIISLNRAFATHKLEEENSHFKNRNLDEAILQGISIHAQNLRHIAKAFSSTNARMLLQGSLNSGREIYAKIIHSYSSRGKFLSITCDNPNIDSILFGYEENGIIQYGAISNVHNGTLLLNNIEALPESTQIKLSNLLSTYEYTPTHSHKKLKLNARVITTSNRNLKKLCEEKRFKYDLYHRISIISVQVADIEERDQDLDEMILYYLNFYKSDFDLSNTAIQELHQQIKLEYSSATIQHFLQFKHFVERYIFRHYFQSNLQNSDNRVNECHESQNDELHNIYNLPYKEAKMEFERVYIEKQLTKNNNNISKVAREMGVNRSSLHRKLPKKLLS